MDEQTLALYAQGNSVEDVRRLVSKIYGISLSAGKVSGDHRWGAAADWQWRSRLLLAFMR
ncbi:MAG: hypothetical protein IPK21_23375 [Haliscomenobacter sp.]|nr:hypothetical protein [Haliscomenobacter sp.]